MKNHLFQAAIIDLDGVITKTALVHSAAWKEMFDEYLRYREKEYGEVFREFTHAFDYLKYIDGKPRYKGVESFLESRGVYIPYGDPSDHPDKETICGLGNKKNNFFNKVLARDGVEVYDSTIDLIRQLKREGIKIGVASSSKNCRIVLERAGLIELFETLVDGEVSAKLGLRGKPEPDIFTTACDNLDVSYKRTIIVEDAVSGVRAGKNGNFGLVIGIAREGNGEELRKNGADIVVDDISALGGIKTLDEWFDSQDLR
jgi:beta-phosphoglucomutase family hydrolase